jgi:alkanesulfonate monooxygenase SsuD/methylene tetrahydromethanopterin reductase-like flavin-dependent oxidoreductase (luciferase family)
MKFMLFILPTVPGTLEDRKRLRPIGRNKERYQQMLDEMRRLAILADQAGFDVFATTEHHFHSEGYGTSVAPLLLYAGFARGYQDRWVNVLGQQYHVTGAPMDGSSIDQHNRKVYEEAVKIIKKSWTEETWEYNGQYYKVPFPYEEGIRRWPVAEWTRTYGAPG